MQLFRKDNINWGKIFIVVNIIVAIIIIFIIWKPTKNIEISHYEVLKEEDVDKLASQEYINKFISSVYDQNTDYLYGKLRNSYSAYNEINETEFINLFNNELNYNNVSVVSVKKIQYGNNAIYSTILDINQNRKKVNFIEINGKKWEYTFDDFYNFQITNNSSEYKNIKFTIDSIYQTLDYIEITCYIENMTNNLINIHMEQEDSILLRLDTNEIVQLSNSQIDENLSKVYAGTVSSKTLRFKLDLSNQAKINQIIFDKLEINNERGRLIINLDI